MWRSQEGVPIILFAWLPVKKVHSAEVKRARERELAPDETPEIALPTMTTHRGFPTRRTPAFATSNWGGAGSGGSGLDVRPSGEGETCASGI